MKATVTKRFRDNYEFWISHKLQVGEFSEEEAKELTGMIRQDLIEGPDQLREGLEIIVAAGLTMPATIDDHMERYRLWDGFFESECQEIQAETSSRMVVGINDRIRSSIAQQREEMGVAA